MAKQDDYFDVNKEPWMQAGGFTPDPAEQNTPSTHAGGDELLEPYLGVQHEVAITGDGRQPFIGNWIERKRQRCSFFGNVMVTLTAAVVGGPFAVLGAFMSGRQTSIAILYAVIVAPVIEELLKQSGMIYLLEKKPYRLFSAAQFLFSAFVSSLIFAAVENVMYIHLYARPVEMENPAAYAMFRWTVCTSLHLVCSLIASVGLIRLWLRQRSDGRVVELVGASPFFMAAMIIHGLYNLAVMVWNPKF